MPDSPTASVPKPAWLPWWKPSAKERLARFLVFDLWSGLVRRFHRAPHVYRARRIAAPLPGSRPPEAEGELLDAFRFYNRHWEEVDLARDEYLYEVEGPCRIDPMGGWAILPGFGVLEESAPHGYNMGLPGLRTHLRPPTLRLDSVVLLTDPFDTNHMHFLNEILGRLALFERRGVSRSIPVLITKRLADYPLWKECLANGAPELRDRNWIVQDGTVRIEAARVIFGKPAIHDRETGEGVLRLIGCCPPPPPGPGRKIFLTRRGRRTFANLAEIEAVAAREGLEVVDPGTLPFAAQMALFADASAIVGPHGSAFDNILFRQGAPLRILEIFPPGFTPPFHCWQAAAFGYAYRGLRAPDAGGPLSSGPEAELANFHFDADAFAAALRRFLEETETGAAAPSPLATP
ncbi:MAG TPA: glycosyltransferase family 61 protein [Candidatus Methylacidiphilales bacterium]